MQRRKQQERKKVCPHGNQSKENCYFCQMEADNGYSDNGEIERIRSSSRLSNQRKMRIVSPLTVSFALQILVLIADWKKRWRNIIKYTTISP